MTRRETIKGTIYGKRAIALFKADCLNVLPDIPAGTIHLVLADLPYGTTSRLMWDSVIPMDRLWLQYRRILADEGLVILFAAQPFCCVLMNGNPEWFKYDLIWQKSNIVGFLDAQRRPLRLHEHVLVFGPKQGTYNPQMRKGNVHQRGGRGIGSEIYGHDSATFNNNRTESDEYFPVSIIDVAYDEDRHHPTQKPVPLLEWLIKTFSNPREIVLDNTMGSGSTGVAAVNTGRKFIGIELGEDAEKDYYGVAVTRIKEAVLVRKQIMDTTRGRDNDDDRPRPE